MFNSLLKHWPAIYGGGCAALIVLVGVANILNYYPEIPVSMSKEDILSPDHNEFVAERYALFVNPAKNENWWNHRYRYLKKIGLLNSDVTAGYDADLTETSLNGKCQNFYLAKEESANNNNKIWKFCSIGGTEVKTTDQTEDHLHYPIIKYLPPKKTKLIPSFTDSSSRWFWIMQDKLFFGNNGWGKNESDESWKKLYEQKRNYGELKVRDKCIEKLNESINSIDEFDKHSKYCYLKEIPKKD